MMLDRVSVHYCCFFFFSSRRRHTRFDCDWSSDVCSSDLDIFAISPAEKEANAPVRREIGRSELSTTFAVGEESDISLPKGPSGEVRPITAPIDRTDAAVRRGEEDRGDGGGRTPQDGPLFPPRPQDR